jgi:hypothetical protein
VIWSCTIAWVGLLTVTAPATISEVLLNEAVVRPCVNVVNWPVIVMVGFVPWTPKFGLKVTVGNPRSTVKTLLPVATSEPVVTVTERAPIIALAAMEIFTVKEVELVTVTVFTVTSAEPKLTVDVFCTKWVNWPVMMMLSLASA